MTSQVSGALGVLLERPRVLILSVCFTSGWAVGLGKASHVCTAPTAATARITLALFSPRRAAPTAMYLYGTSGEYSALASMNASTAAGEAGRGAKPWARQNLTKLSQSLA